MKTAQKIKIVTVLLLVWSLPMLPCMSSTKGRPRSAAPSDSQRDWDGNGFDSVGVFDQNTGQRHSARG